MCKKYIFIYLLVYGLAFSNDFIVKNIGISKILGCPKNSIIEFVKEEADINGDGFRDFLVYKPSYDGSLWVKIWIIYGSEEDFPEEISLCAINSFYSEIDISYPYFPFQIKISDMNRDGYDDIIFSRTLKIEEKRVCIFIIYGSSNFPKYIFLDNPPKDLRISVFYIDDKKYEYFGNVIELVDINLDGFSDLITSSIIYDEKHQEIIGEIYFFYGSKEGFPEIIYLKNPKYARKKMDKLSKKYLINKI